MAEKHVLLALQSEQNQRLDVFISSKLSDSLSRSYIQKLIESGAVAVNGKTEKRSYKLSLGDSVEINIPDPVKSDIRPEDIPVEIIYEDGDIAVINKPAGITVHTGSGVTSGTLVNALLYHLDDLSSIGGEERPGIVHRLDKDTSGLMVIAKNDIAHRSLSEQFADRKIDKRYAAIVIGAPRIRKDTITTFIARHATIRTKMAVSESGRTAITDYETDKVYTTKEGTFSLLSIKIHTGRTHQIRVHLSHAGNPVVGDRIYSKSFKKYDSCLMLAAVSLSFRHPTKGETMSFNIELPDHMKKFLEKLGKLSE